MGCRWRSCCAPVASSANSTEPWEVGWQGCLSGSKCLIKGMLRWMQVSAVSRACCTAAPTLLHTPLPAVPVRTPAEHPLRLHSWRLRFYAAATMFQPSAEAADAHLRGVLAAAAGDEAAADPPDMQELLAAAAAGEAPAGLQADEAWMPGLCSAVVFCLFCRREWHNTRAPSLPAVLRRQRAGRPGHALVPRLPPRVPAPHAVWGARGHRPPGGL